MAQVKSAKKKPPAAKKPPHQAKFDALAAQVAKLSKLIAALESA